MLHKDATSNNQNLEATPYKKGACAATYHPPRSLSKLDEQDMRDSAEGPRTNS